jgi:hypothetical protein
MSAERREVLDPRIQDALDELRGTIAERYPSVRFEVARDIEEPENFDLLTAVDLEDPDEVLDLVIDRLVELQVEQRIPVHVVPIRTPERVLQEMRSNPRPARQFHRAVSSKG